ncbi:ATP-grasp domain-containing protein [Actinoallomurus soli]|uniref:ATP-grasp domain-containing protein n=1 Tax=Actinoallomurus soli TaxID=2952535 RepID=UPI002092813E|nr:siderophore biosynthesis protein [Actinoallomurus soli]MCO5973980.1 siderophore biosynthesis protein [Actinoallomurus soli]
MRLYIVAGKRTDSVTHGFLPAAAALGLDVTLLTDRPWPEETVRCDVTDFRAIIDEISRREAPAAIFSNSDHLQAPTALAAAYFGLPGKDWRAALRTKNKALMRRALGGVFAVEFLPGQESPALADAPYPLVVKPREGVASEDVFLVRDAAELAARCREIWSRRPGALVAEEYLPGDLHTLETLNGRVLGSFRTTLSPPPHFVEERLDWAPPPCAGQVLDALERLGAGFGACHTEYLVHEGRARLVEVNYRIIGDHCDFLLGELLGVPIFEWVLRAHLGEPVPEPPAATGHAAVDSVLADRSGTLTAAPERHEYTDEGVRVAYWPVRSTGDVIALTRTNRDYLGTIRAIGPDAARVDAAIRRFRARNRWEITP